MNEGDSVSVREAYLGLLERLDRVLIENPDLVSTLAQAKRSVFEDSWQISVLTEVEDHSGRYYTHQHAPGCVEELAIGTVNGPRSKYGKAILSAKLGMDAIKSCLEALAQPYVDPKAEG